MVHSSSIFQDLSLIRKQSPLVHNITNFVVMNNTANALLCLGASPVMAHALEEVEDMVNISSALVINMGTLNPEWTAGMIKAGKAALKKGIPIVFDPVGVGATPYRNKVASEILKECKPSIIRANASEIMALARENCATKGVDSTTSSNSAIESAKKLSKETNAIVVISGEEDFITDGVNILSVKNGSPLMSKVTGMGCTASAITGAFAAVNNNYLLSATHAMAIMSIVGEIAVKKSNGPGTLQTNFLDTLYSITLADIENTLKK